MEKKMKQLERACQFDFVQDTQKVFREMLEAIANPGTIRRITKQAEVWNRKEGALAALGCVVLDHEKSMFVEKNPHLVELLHDLTLSDEQQLEAEDYVFLSSELNDASMQEIIKNVKKGTYADPQESATLFLFCETLKGTEEITINGPGISGEKRIQTTSYIKNALKIRQSFHIEYPLGVDFFFVTEQGELMSMPRLCKQIEKEV